ncbi:MAG: hypothetical protein KBS95_06605, partial [Alistipes sp.]|nr:hypothetical protein [Candidatus Alistipes equi]
MKKTIILSALCMLFAVSCSKGIVEIDENNVNNPSKNLEKKTFSIENDVTRTFIDGKIIKWEVGDKIGIMDNIDNTVVREFSVESVSEDGRKAIITGEVTQGADFFAAVYPVDAANSVDFQSSKITFTIPSSQTLSTSCNHDKLAIVSAAFLDNGKFIFKNAFSLLKFKMTQENVSKVILRNTGSAPLAGTSTIDFSDDLSVTIAGTTKSITLSGEFENEKEYYIALAPCQMAGTMELFFASDEKQSIAYKTTEKTFT